MQTLATTISWGYSFLEEGNKIMSIYCVYSLPIQGRIWNTARWRHTEDWVSPEFFHQSHRYERFWEVARESLQSAGWSGADYVLSPRTRSCPRVWILCGFHPINLEQFHWTLFLASAFHFQIDNRNGHWPDTLTHWTKAPLRVYPGPRIERWSEHWSL